MKLPTLDQPHRYRGLYVYDFGPWAAVGYTADEIALLLESDTYRNGKVYKIVRAGPDGHLELKGLSAERFQLESGMFFQRDAERAARADFEALCDLARRCPPPARAVVHLADRGPAAGRTRYVTALIYPAEYEDEMAAWLLENTYAGGETVEGGISHVSDYQVQAKTVLAREQLWSTATTPARSTADVLASVRQPVQRRPGEIAC